MTMLKIGHSPESNGLKTMGGSETRCYGPRADR